ncbi:MAG TPA: PAS domain S-box protein [Longimicrobium sp.]|nr:PAS domain S-box protein [Longimicrobium sp.]
MTGAEAVRLLPCLASAALSAWVGVHCWRRRARPGAGAYAVVALSQAACTLGFVLELLSPGLAGKIFWDDAQYLALAPLPAGMVAFALDYTGRRPAHPARTLGLLTLPSVVFAALAFSDRLHGLVRASPRLVPGEPFAALVYDFTPATLAWAAYVLGLILGACVLLTARWIRAHPLYRAQASLVQVGVLLPWVSGVLTLTVLRDSPLRDSTPLTFGLANLLVAWGLFRARLFDVGPVARHAVVESMGDAVYVLDAAGRVVDLNPAARAVLGVDADGAIGRDAADVLPLPPGSFPADGARGEVQVGSGPERRHAEVSVYPLPGPRGEAAGRVVVVRDITERIRVEEALRESRTRFDRIVANVPGIVYQFRLEPDGTPGFPWVSDAIGPILGLEPAEVVADAETFLGVVHSDDAGLFRDAIARSAAEQAPWAWRGRVTRRDGELRWLHAQSQPRTLEDGSVLWDGVAVDVTEAARTAEALREARDGLEHRVRERTAELEAANAALRAEVDQRAHAQAALREGEERFRAMVESLSEAILVTDADGIVQYASPRIEEVTGYAPAEMLGRRASSLLVSGAELHAADERLAARRRGESGRGEIPITRRDGSRAWVEVIGTALRDGEGRPMGGLDALTDVTERRRAAEELRAVQERFRMLVEAVRDYAIVALDPEGYVVSWNAGAERISGYAAEQILGRHVSVFYPPEEVEAGRVRRAQEETLQEGRCEMEGWRLRADGSRYWAHTVLTRLLDEEGQPAGFASITRDLTDRREAEAALRRAEEQLRHSQKMEAVGRLAGGIAHDFNNLLMAIGGNAQLLLRRAAPDDPSRPGLEEVRKATDRAADLTKQLLAFSRRQVLAPRVVDLAGAVTEMQRMLERLLGPGIDLALRLAADTPRVRADASQVEQVVMNLVVNARDAMPGGGVIRVETGVAVLTDDDVRRHPFLRPGRYAGLVVADGGCGMDEHTLERIFEPFFTTKEVGSGTGLGLSTVYGIVKQSGGYVVAESAPGEGAVFRVYLPPAEEEAGRPAPPAAGPTPRGWETVLLVEDEDAVRGVVREALRLSGYEVLEARGGAEAMELAEAREGAIHLVLTDVMMPGASGPQTARRVLALHPEARVLYVSGQAMPDGGDGPPGEWLQKPVSPDALARRVREVLDRPVGAPR